METLYYKDYIYYSLDNIEKLKETNEYEIQKLKNELKEVLENNKQLRLKIKLLETYIKRMEDKK